MESAGVGDHNIENSEFNSSDIEYEPEPRSIKRYGAQSIQEIIDNAAFDRLSSKRAVKTPEFGCGAPNTQYQQSLWTVRFNAFREHTLRLQLSNPFNGDDIIRFLDAMIPKIRIKSPENRHLACEPSRALLGL
ncbi:hypothetical protein FQN54_000133 [Arachnomyces sp. PD_36]|nr:hypothetical protein FQN54_000133 [Arachnomyces sp. PD_36]